MSKLSNTILMLSYLQNGKKYSISELSEKLEVSPRMVRIYKEDLEKAGFIIDTIYGPYGGYVLRKSCINIFPSFNNYDILMLKKVKECKIDDDLQAYVGALLKRIEACMEPVDDIMFTGGERELYNTISRAIKEKRKVMITYLSLEKGESKRTIHPLEIFAFNNNFGVAAFCEVKKDLRHFEFSRIKSFRILEEYY